MDSIRERLVQFVIKLYFWQVPKKDLTLAETSWYLHSKYQDSDRLSLTAATLKYEILRTRQLCLIWRSSNLQKPKSPDPENYG